MDASLLEALPGALARVPEAARTLLLGSGAWGWMAHWNSHEGGRFSRVALQTYLEVQNLDFIVDGSAQDSVEQCMERCRRWSPKAVG